MKLVVQGVELILQTVQGLGSILSYNGYGAYSKGCGAYLVDFRSGIDPPKASFLRVPLYFPAWLLAGNKGI